MAETNATPTSLSDLAGQIAGGIEILEDYYRDKGLPMPSLAMGGPVDTVIHDDVDMERTRLTVLEAAIELRDVLEGPTMQLRPVLNATSLQFIYEYDIPAKVPVDGEISYEDLGRLCGVETGIVRRVLRFAMAWHRVFWEHREGFVSHSPASKLLADSPDAVAGVGAMFDSAYQGFAHTVEALRKYPQQTPFSCGWTLAHNSSVPIWASPPKRVDQADRTARAMRQFTRGFGHDTTSLLTGFDWSSLNDQPTARASIIDLGGGNGHASILLAQKYPNLQFQVQDLPHVINGVDQADIPPSVHNRISFLAHDFTQPQPQSSSDVDVYLLRQILHDWPDDECIVILRALIPTLKKGARIVVNDFVVSAPGAVSPHIERHIRAMDMIVLTLAGAKEREFTDWQELFRRADPRFADVSYRQPETCCMAVIEAKWSG